MGCGFMNGVYGPMLPGTTDRIITYLVESIEYIVGKEVSLRTS